MHIQGRLWFIARCPLHLSLPEALFRNGAADFPESGVMCQPGRAGQWAGSSALVVASDPKPHEFGGNHEQH